MATMTRGNQRIQVADKQIDKFVSRGWQLEGAISLTPKSTTKKPTNSKRIKPVEAVVEQQPTVEDEQDAEEIDAFIQDNFNQEGEN